ncbi:MAG TPA: aminoglycoside phosphotransferase family protein [Fimbriimonadaceae bacterium]|nr:aminoglycoside phosphotransferase family protein [Fimbriimonadaceae bacterium]
MEVSPALVANVRQVWGREGDRWLAQLPTLIADLRRRWGLSEPVPYSDLSYHYVARTTLEGKDVTLKIGCDLEGLRREARALESLGGPIVSLIDSDLKLGALLLEHAEPGSTLQSIWEPEEDHKITPILAGLMKDVRRTAPGTDFPTVGQWLQCILRFRPPFFKEAERLVESVSFESAGRFLLHGDLHHGNVLKRGEHWAVIDPKGVVGPPAFEVYSLLLNPIIATADQLVHLLPDRLELLSNVLDLPVRELAAWGFLGVEMSMAWDIEDGGEASEGSAQVAKSLMARL